MKRDTGGVVIVLILILITIIPSISSSTVDVVYVSTIYDLLNNEGALAINISLKTTSPIYIAMPILVFGEDITATFLSNETRGGIELLFVDYSEENKTIHLITQGEGVILLYFLVEGLFDEEGPGYFTVDVNTNYLRNVVDNIIVDITVIGHFEVESVNISGESRLVARREGNYTKITMTGFSESTLMLSWVLEETPGNLTTPLITTNTTTPVTNGIYSGLLVILIAVAATTIIGLGVLLYHIRVRRRIVIERTGYIYDDATRSILRVLGKAREKGLTQSDIVRETSLPKSSVSRRIKRLRDEGLVEIRRSGKFNYVFLTDKGLELIRSLKIGEEK